MIPKSIGILGGAGPFASAFLLTKILSICSEKYGCYRDSSFPKIILISIPFTEMLGPQIEAEKIRQELLHGLQELKLLKAEVLTVACNTLHAFLNISDVQDSFMHMPQILAAKLRDSVSEVPLVLCTTTACKFELHRQFFRCNYPALEVQAQVDQLIDDILRGCNEAVVIAKLESLVNSQSSNKIILGCTELSMYAHKLKCPQKTVIDPLDMVANQIVNFSFNNKE